MSPHLPVELWLDIFRWATISKLTPALYATEYFPFQSHNAMAFIDEEAVEVKRTLVTVCKLWRSLAKDLLLEDVIISHDGSLLRRALKGQEEDNGYRRVRRACLPYSSCTPYHKDLAGAASIIKSCMQLEVLVRPYRPRAEEMRFEIAAEECPTLTSLKRIDWWHYNDAARSGGFNALTDVLCAAPNLRYLTISGDLWLNLVHRNPIDLPHLTTLRIGRTNVLFMHQITRWNLPSLCHLIIDTYSTDRLFEGFWDKFGSQIKTVELGRNLKFYVLDLVYHIIAHCPNLEELSYYVFFTAMPHQPETRHMNLKTVRFHSYPNDFFAHGSEHFWDHLREHFMGYGGPLYPAMKQISLHGEWDGIQGDPRYQALVRPLHERGQHVVQAHSV